MKAIVGFVLGIIVGTSAFIINFNPHDIEPQSVYSSEFLERQQAILDLFDDVCEESTNTNITHLAEQFSMEEFTNQADVLWTNSEAIEEFKRVYGTSGEGLTKKDHAFYECNEKKIDELKAVYGILYHAKSFNSFYKIAAWARQNINCELFVDALYAALINRKDTNKISIPAAYEVLPHYYINREGLAKAMMIYRNKDNSLGEAEGVHMIGNVLTVDTNYTGAFFNNQDESKLAYFREDVGLNSFYYYAKLRKSHWVKEVNNENLKGLGEYWYYITRQLNARYNLERVTNGLKPVEGITWADPLNTEYTYDPHLINRNGSYFPSRNNFILENPEYVAKLNGYKSNLLNNVMNTNKIDRMQSVVDFWSAENYRYDFLARCILGKDECLDDVASSPSSLQHFATSLRDPVFWRLNKHYLDLFNEVLNGLEPYAHNQLHFPGVEIINVEVKKMQTFFDYNEYQITNSIKQNKVDSTINVNIGQPRLNHKPFTITINAASLVSQKALVKIFIGPKFSPTEIGVYKDLLKQLDSFEYNLNIGNNVIVRKSDDITNIAEDFVSLEDLYRKVQVARDAIEPFILRKIEYTIGFPSRLVIPKGTSEGFPLQLYVIIAPFVKPLNEGILELNTEVVSLSYPFDRPIENSKLYDLSNTFFKDFALIHKGDNKVYNYGGDGSSKNWYSTGKNSYDPAEKNSYDYQSKKQSGSYDYQKKSGSYDYASKKDQYKSKNYDYKSRQNGESTVRTLSENENLEVLPVESTSDMNVIPITNSVSRQLVIDEKKNDNANQNSNKIYDFNSVEVANNEEYPEKIILNLQSKSPFKNIDLNNKKLGNYEYEKNKDNKKQNLNDIDYYLGQHTKDQSKFEKQSGQSKEEKTIDDEQITEVKNTLD